MKPYHPFGKILTPQSPGYVIGDAGKTGNAQVTIRDVYQTVKC